MWCKLKSAVSQATLNRLVARIDLQSQLPSDSETFVKTFFLDGQGGVANIDLLRDLHLELWPQMGDKVNFKAPAIDHASLLFKRAGAPGTGLHQDRPYWIGREETPSIFSVWIALEDISREKGCLKLLSGNELDASQMSNFHKGALIKHDHIPNATGGFPLLISGSDAQEIQRTMRFVELKKGECVAFDSFEPHMSTENQTVAPRLAMKIAYCEGGGKARNLILVDKLEAGI